MLPFFVDLLVRAAFRRDDRKEAAHALLGLVAGGIGPIILLAIHNSALSGDPLLPARFVAGGWGGGVVGISSIDGMMASENETASVMEFKDNQWYRFRLQVTKNKIDVWIDDKQVIDFEYTGRQITIHPSMDLATPLGLSTCITRSAFRNIRIREIAPSPNQE